MQRQRHSHGSTFPRHFRTRVLVNIVALSDQRARGNAGRERARSLVCEKNKHTS
jgi:hypothetical protein